jgi:hypothetical protein
MAGTGEQAEIAGRMFALLDTDHYTELTNDSVRGRNAQKRIESSRADVFISIVPVQEVVQGWLALINQCKSGRDQVHGYARFQHSIATLSKLTVLPFDEEAADRSRDFARNGCELEQWTSRSRPSAWLTTPLCSLLISRISG